ncbi:uncharacterized protein LOC126845079 isoform X2 [Adelges cooleyi]|uniref:uncharacterized protein LOC126845079 isoform X1 n=1 Tax=Adelges cooleyi TaxID=133065 RepID=UPI002180097A|nr:uncharacterized protein LOC126845079 isoform X1 [Adelges cooleyi]XP_050439599.1 uncharacterized protein LOC126845079 isoform X2 [Adelges cooleyi]
MCSKINVILFFCVTLYFLQCQGDVATPKQRDRIYEIVRDYLTRESTIDLEEVRGIIAKAAEKLKINKDIPSVDDLKTSGSNYTYDIKDVSSYIKSYFGPRLPSGILATAALLFGQRKKTDFNYQEVISFQQLKEVINAIQENNANPEIKFDYNKVPKTAIPYKMENSNFKFIKKEVELIVEKSLFDGKKFVGPLFNRP